MKKLTVIVDTSVLLDFFVDKEPLAFYAKKIFSLCHAGEIAGLVKAQSLVDLFHALESSISTSDRRKILLLLANMFFVYDLSETKNYSIELAIFFDSLLGKTDLRHAEFPDADYIIESSVENFFYNDLPVLTSAEFLNIYERSKATARIASLGVSQKQPKTEDDWQLRLRALAYENNL